MNKLIVVNLLGGPGIGKSTSAAAVYSLLKYDGYNVEMAREYAKDKVWEGSYGVLDDQLYILGKQHHRLHTLRGKADIAITDSPIILSSVYNREYSWMFDELALEAYSNYDNLNFVWKRTKPYQQKGRMQTEEQAKEVDNVVLAFLHKHNIPYTEVEYGWDGFRKVADLAVNQLNRSNKESNKVSSKINETKGGDAEDGNSGN